MGQSRLARWAAWWALVALAALAADGAGRARESAALARRRAPEVTAPAACVVELATGAILWGRDIHTPRAPASVTKMMTALVAVDLAPLDTKVTIQESDLVGESSMGLESGETLPLEALFYGLLLPSGNDAATAIARTLGKQPGDTDADAERAALRGQDECEGEGARHDGDAFRQSARPRRTEPPDERRRPRA